MKTRIVKGRCRAAAMAALLLLPCLARANERPLHPGTGEGTDDFSQPTVVSRWDGALTDAIGRSGMGPTPAARALAIVHTCIFDAWAAYTKRAVGTRLGGKLRRPPAEWTAANKRTATSYAAYRALVDLFPQEQAELFDPLMAQLGYDPADTSQDPTAPAGIGNLACGAVLAYRHADGSNQLGDLHPGAYSDYTGYEPRNPPSTLPVDPATVVDPSHWQPIVYVDGEETVVQEFLTPFWGMVKPFALPRGDALRGLLELFGPARYGSWAYWQQAREIVALSAALDDRTKMIAEYWANGPNDCQAPGHYHIFGRWVSERDHHGIDQDVKMFFALGNAMLDASIAIWDIKRVGDSERPSTAIPYLFAGKPIRAWAGPGQGTQVIDGAQWVPYLQAPYHSTPFPEFSSGHSAFGAAGAEILRRATGSDRFGYSVTFPPGSSAVEPGITPSEPVTLEYRTFSEAADEDGISRRYGGVHFLAGDYASRLAGRIVGGTAWARAHSYIDPPRR